MRVDLRGEPREIADGRMGEDDVCRWVRIEESEHVLAERRDPPTGVHEHRQSGLGCDPDRLADHRVVHAEGFPPRVQLEPDAALLDPTIELPEGTVAGAGIDADERKKPSAARIGFGHDAVVGGLVPARVHARHDDGSAMPGVLEMADQISGRADHAVRVAESGMGMGVPDLRVVGEAAQRRSVPRFEEGHVGTVPAVGSRPGVRFGTLRRPDQGTDEMTRLADGPTVEVYAEIEAPIEDVWDLVTDINVSARFQDEFQSAEWLDDGPRLGARFRGRNTLGSRTWETVSTITAYEEPRVFQWTVNDVDDPVATWTFLLDEAEGTTTVRYHRVVGPGPSGLKAAIEKYPDREEEFIARRDEQHRTHMQAVLDGVKSLAENP